MQADKDSESQSDNTDETLKSVTYSCVFFYNSRRNTIFSIKNNVRVWFRLG